MPDSWIRDSLEVNRPGGPRIQHALHDMFRKRPLPALIEWAGMSNLRERGAEAFVADLPDARPEMFDGGHWLLESHLEEVAELINDFLDGTMTAN